MSDISCLEELSDDEIAFRCSPKYPHRRTIDDTSIVRLLDHVVVKIGYHYAVTQDEANNQRRAREILDPSIVYVPEVYRYFTRKPPDNGKCPTIAYGYLVMEYVEGVPLRNVDVSSKDLDKVEAALQYFRTIPGNSPGPLAGGWTRGQLWIEDDYIQPKSLYDIEEYYNGRQLRQDPICIQGYDLIFCHLNVTARNIIKRPDGALCFINWESAGFYPELFERCALDLSLRWKDKWSTSIPGRLSSLSDDEVSQMERLHKAVGLAVQYAYSPPVKKRAFKAKIPKGLFKRNTEICSTLVMRPTPNL